MTTKDASNNMSDSHKAALVQGRAEARVIRDYLRALREQHPRPGRKRTTETVKRRLGAIEEELARPDLESEDPLRVLELIQERIDLTNELASMESVQDIATLEADFVRVALAFAARKGITYAAWRQMGIPAAVLRRAGIRSSAA